LTALSAILILTGVRLIEWEQMRQIWNASKNDLHNKNTDCGKIVNKNYQDSPASRSSEEVRQLFESNGCTACHSIEAKGGCLGTPLDGIGAYRTKVFLLSRITDSQAAIDQFNKLYGKAELMPHPRINSKDAEHIVDYLLTLSMPQGGYFIQSHNTGAILNGNGKVVTKQISKAQNSTILGKSLLYDRGCIACHSINNIGGLLLPILAALAENVTEPIFTNILPMLNFLHNSILMNIKQKGWLCLPLV
jgi:cytochrome c551/c552